MCKKLIIAVLALSFCLISSARATVSWDFENGSSHRFDLWSVQAAGAAIDDPETAGDEAKTGVGGPSGLPGNGLAWSIGSPDQYDGLKPAVEEGDKIKADGTMEYNQPGTNHPFTFPVNERGQSGYLNTYNLSQWGDNLHTADNDQIATSVPVTLGENAVLTIWAYGGGSGTHAPEYDPNPDLVYSNGSSGIAVISPDDYSLLASVLCDGHGDLKEHTLDLSALAGQTVLIEVVDAFDGGWGWLAVDEIQISNTDQNPVAGFICQLTEDELAWGFDAAQVDHLISLGYEVDVISHLDLAEGIFTTADANEYDVLVISESPNSNGCDSIIGTSAPTMHQEAFGWDNHFFMGVRTNIRWIDGQTQVEVVNDTHPIMVDAGFPVGKLPWFTAPEKYTTEDIDMMAPGAELLVKADTEDAAVVFAIEKGAELANGNSAAGRVVCFSISGAQDGANQVGGILDASIMAPEQWALYDAALRWLDPAPTPMPEPIADYSFDVDASDATGNFNGTLEGDAAIVDDAERGAVLGLTADGYVSVPPALANELDNFSFTAWVNFGGTIQWAGLLGMGSATDHSTPYWDFHMRADGVLSYYASLVDVWPGDGTAQTVTGFTIPAEWIQIGFTFELGTGGTVYVNGAAQTQEPWNSSNDHDVSPSMIAAEIVTIGRDTFNQGTLTNTLIDDFKFYNVALSAEDVAAIYDDEK